MILSRNSKRLKIGLERRLSSEENLFLQRTGFSSQHSHGSFQLSINSVQFRESNALFTPPQTHDHGAQTNM